MNRPFSPDPPSRISLAYFALAHASLALAAALMIWVPNTLTAFFFQPRVIATVHLVTLGWISSSILGALYMIAPMALRTRLSVGTVDWVAFAFYAVGLSGMVSHFWIHQPSGMLWSAAMLLLAAAWVGGKTVGAVVPAPIEPASRAAISFAFANFALAAAVGAFMGWVQIYPATTGIDFATLTAHVLLATLGWATMMVLGAGYRLLPMLLPSAPPRRIVSLASVILLEMGVLYLAVELLWGLPGRMDAVALVALGILLFLANLVWLRAHPRRRARTLPRWDLGRLQIFEATFYLMLALGLGIWLARTGLRSETLYEWLPVTVALLLVGFLGQVIAGVSARLFPLFLWIRSFKSRTDPPLPPPPGTLPSLSLAALIFLAWTGAVPLLACALITHLPAPMRAAGLLLLAAMVGSALQLIAVERRITRSRRPHDLSASRMA